MNQINCFIYENDWYFAQYTELRFLNNLMAGSDLAATCWEATRGKILSQAVSLPYKLNIYEIGTPSNPFTQRYLTQQ